MNTITSMIRRLIDKYKKSIFLFVILSIILMGTILRLLIIDYRGGDHLIYKLAIKQFVSGINPYKYTVLSFRIKEGLDHGYAYLPSLLYVQSFIWVFSNKIGLDLSTVVLFKIPVYLADLGIFLIIVRKLKKYSLKAAIIGATFWFLNPYFIARYEYTLYDPLFLLFLLLAIEFLESKSFLSGIFVSTAITFKTIPILFLPVMFFKTNNKVKFIVGGILVAVIITLPFLTNVEDFYYLINGSILVHSSRGIQGRPILSFLSYYLHPIGINFLQSEYSSIYSFSSLVVGPLVAMYMYFKKNVKDVYVLGMVIFGIYFLLTPVMNRTHILWILPFLLVGTYKIISKNFSKNTFAVYAITNVLIYLVLFGYLYIWNSGFKPPKNYGERISISTKNQKEWELKRLLRHEYYETRGKIQATHPNEFSVQ